MKPVFSIILFLGSLSSFAQNQSECDSLSNELLAVSGAFENVQLLDSLLEVDLQKLANCGSWDAIDKQIMDKEYLKEIVSASLKDEGEFPTYAAVFDIFDQIKKSELYPAIRLSKETFETLSGKTVNWDNLEYDKIRKILITEDEFSKFQDFLGHNKFAGAISYDYLLEQYYNSTEQ